MSDRAGSFATSSGGIPTASSYYNRAHFPIPLSIDIIVVALILAGVVIGVLHIGIALLALLSVVLTLLVTSPALRPWFPLYFRCYLLATAGIVAAYGGDGIFYVPLWALAIYLWQCARRHGEGGLM